MAKDKEVNRLAGRRFCKTAHVNPLVAFKALLDSIQIYDNLIPLIVDSIRYLTPFGFDVLVFLVIDYLVRCVIHP